MKNKFFMSLAGGLLLLTGCTGLNVDVDSLYTKYPNNDIAVEAKMADVYYQLRGCFGRRYMEAQELSSDEYTAVSYGGGWYDNGAYAHPSLHAYTKDDATIDWMGELMSGCTKANTVIRDLTNDGADEKYIARARAMRAFFEFVMMDCWGDAPIMDHIVAKDEVLERSPRAKVAEFIESELKDIIPLLTDEVSANTYGKPTKWMAEALLVKLCLNWPVYTAASVDQYDAATAKNEKLDECIKYCDDIINSKKFNLGSVPYRKKFSYDNGCKIEDFIYALPYDTYTAMGMQYGRAITWKQAKDAAKSYYGMKLHNSAGGYVTMTPECAALFSLPGDERNQLILRDTVHVYDPTTQLPTKEVALDKAGNPIVLTSSITLKTNDEHLDVGDNVNGYNQGNRNVKFFVTDDDFKNGRNQSNDLPIFRYADILLEKAEAITRGGKATNGDTPQSLFNQIRSYVKAPVIDHNPSLKETLDERGREFLGENWRRNDMIRFGTFEGQFFPHYTGFPTANFDKTHRIFPVHKDILNVNPTWKQNPGYEK